MEEVNRISEARVAVAESRRILKRRTLLEIESLARTRTRVAIETLVKVMLNEDAPASARVAAAVAILDRGWGKPVQRLASEDGKPLELIHRIERVIVHDGAQSTEHIKEAHILEIPPRSQSSENEPS